jgi:hypothetical protein
LNWNLMTFRVLYGGGEGDSWGPAMDPAAVFFILLAVLAGFCGPVVMVLGVMFVKSKSSAAGREQDGNAQCGAGPCRGFDMPTCLPVSVALLIAVGVFVFGAVRLAVAVTSGGKVEAADDSRGWEAAQGGLAICFGCAYAAVIKFWFWRGKGLGEKCGAWLAARPAPPPPAAP